MNKKEHLKQIIKDNPGLLACPVCREALRAGDTYAIACPNRHSFDLSASGYVNLLTSANHSEYGSEMLGSRKLVGQSGFFDGLIRAVADVVLKHIRGPMTLLDAGCGEGTQLTRLTGVLAKNSPCNATGIGVDISKEGIRIAAREYPGSLWLVADLAKLPLADGTVDVVVNVLSPSNYAEFGRVLKPGGLLVKAVPGEGYLKELRRMLYSDGEKQQYNNDRVARLFEGSFKTVEKRRVSQSFGVPKELWPHIVAMTPLAWGVNCKQLQQVVEQAQPGVTQDFLLLVGKK